MGVWVVFMESGVPEVFYARCHRCGCLGDHEVVRLEPLSGGESGLRLVRMVCSGCAREFSVVWDGPVDEGVR